jgi:hypothetical protein
MLFSGELQHLDELDHRHLVDKCRSVFNARIVLQRSLV